MLRLKIFLSSLLIFLLVSRPLYAEEIDCRFTPTAEPNVQDDYVVFTRLEAIKLGLWLKVCPPKYDALINELEEQNLRLEAREALTASVAKERLEIIKLKDRDIELLESRSSLDLGLVAAIATTALALGFGLGFIVTQ